MICANCGTENQANNRFCVKCASLLGVGLSEYDSPIRDANTGDPTHIGIEKEDQQLSTQARNSIGDTYASGTTRVVSSTYRDAAIDNSDQIEFDNPGASDALLWPPEAVFVPSTDEGEGEESLLDLPYFEDAQADDVFEQSLSGVVLADLEIAESPEKDLHAVDSNEAGLEIADSPEPDLSAADSHEKDPEVADSPLEVVLSDAEVEKLENAENIEQPPLSVPAFIVEDAPQNPELGPAVDGRKWSIVLLRVGGISLIVLAAFAAGIGTGIWLAPKPVIDVPNPAVIPVAETETRRPSPPTGMAYVPGGQFIMGSDSGDEFSRPAHAVQVGPFFIDLTEVTNEDYRKFVIAARHRSPAGWKNGTFPEGKGEFPVTGVSWFDAADYAEWAGKRLPTEEEWEFAARGTDGRIYPWGNDWDPKLANADKGSRGLRSVGGGGRSPFGLFDMSGNAWEWTASEAIAFSGGKNFPKSRLELKIIRGGNWQSGKGKATAVFRGYYGASGEREYSGTSFRCVKDESQE